MCVKLNTEWIAILLCINPSRTIWTTATCEATDSRLFAMARKTQSIRIIKAGSRGYWTTYLGTGGQYAIEMEAPRFGIILHILEKKDQSMAEKIPTKAIDRRKQPGSYGNVQSKDLCRRLSRRQPEARLTAGDLQVKIRRTPNQIRRPKFWEPSITVHDKHQ